MAASLLGAQAKVALLALLSAHLFLLPLPALPRAGLLESGGVLASLAQQITKSVTIQLIAL